MRQIILCLFLCIVRIISNLKYHNNQSQYYIYQISNSFRGCGTLRLAWAAYTARFPLPFSWSLAVLAWFCVGPGRLSPRTRVESPGALARAWIKAGCLNLLRWSAFAGPNYDGDGHVLLHRREQLQQLFHTCLRGIAAVFLHIWYTTFRLFLIGEEERVGVQPHRYVGRVNGTSIFTFRAGGYTSVCCCTP